MHVRETNFTDGFWHLGVSFSPAKLAHEKLSEAEHA
jgi:hypothetical protein